MTLRTSPPSRGAAGSRRRGVAGPQRGAGSGEGGRRGGRGQCLRRGSAWAEPHSDRGGEARTRRCSGGRGWAVTCAYKLPREGGGTWLWPVSCDPSGGWSRSFCFPAASRRRRLCSGATTCVPHLCPALAAQRAAARPQHDGPGGFRHEYRHPDPLRHGGGQEGPRHGRDDPAAQLALHGGQSHFHCCAQGGHCAPVSQASRPLDHVLSVYLGICLGSLMCGLLVLSASLSDGNLTSSLVASRTKFPPLHPSSGSPALEFGSALMAGDGAGGGSGGHLAHC